MFKRTVIDQIEITRDGTINLRLAKEVVDDDGTVISSGWHRTVLPPGGDIDAQIATVNEHLTTGLKCAPVNSAEIDRVKIVAPVVWTEEVRAAWSTRVAAVEAQTIARSR